MGRLLGQDDEEDAGAAAAAGAVAVGVDRAGAGGPLLGEGGPMDGVESSSRTTPRRDKDGRPRKEIAERDRKAIEQRIEEDRERNKRLREGVWAVGGEDEQEMDKMWDEGSDIGEDDYVIAREEADERAQFAKYHRAMLES